MFYNLYKREFFSFFNNNSAYYIMAIYMALSMLFAFFFGLYYVVDNTSLGSFFAFQPYVLIIISSIVAMRSWAEEHKTGTIETLMTFPIKSTNLVLAKFFACWSFGAVLMLMTIPLVLSTNFIIELDYVNIASSYIGLFFSFGLLLSLGCIISALNKLPIVACLFTIFVTWLVIGFNLSQPIKDLSQFLPLSVPLSFSSSLNFSAHYNSFLTGQISIDNFLYFISFMLVIITANVIVIENKRGA